MLKKKNLNRYHDNISLKYTILNRISSIVFLSNFYRKLYLRMSKNMKDDFPLEIRISVCCLVFDYLPPSLSLNRYL
jgi:hypothetical protein